MIKLEGVVFKNSTFFAIKKMSKKMKQVNKFYVRLQKETQIECELVDERLTSFEAKQLTESDSKSVRIDDLAAKIFLDNWMEHHVNS